MSALNEEVNHWFDRRCAKAFWSQRDLPPYKELLEDTVAWLEPQPGQRWLDLGCGSGQLTRRLWLASGGSLAEVVATDCAVVNERSIARLAAEVEPKPAPGVLRFQQGDFSNGLPDFAANSFDGVVSGLAIQYAQHYSQELGRWTTQAYDHLLAEVCRVLKPGGRFVFSVNVPRPMWLRIAWFGIPGFFRTRRPIKFVKDSLRMLRYGSWLKREAARGRFHYLPADQVTAKLKVGGFSEVEYRMSFSQQAYLFRAVK
ncbi:MAG: class I SAM-dependent methyltransferase [Gemmataceae bacterium]